MLDDIKTARKQTCRKALLGMLGIVLVLALSFCGWVYKAKMQRDLNMQLLGAVRKGNAEAARLLLARGADPNIRNEPQHRLSLWKQIQNAFHKDRQTAQDKHSTLLEMAMNSRSKETTDFINAALVKTLLEAGARPNDCSRHHTTPLMVAVMFDSLQTVQMLLDRGANPLAKNDSGCSPIHFVNGSHPDAFKIAELLIKSGCDVNAVTNDGETVLFGSAGYYANIDFLRYLIAHGARVDVVDQNGDTPLIQCIELNVSPEDTDIAEVLIAHGADVNHRNKAGHTALSLAKGENNKQIVRLLEAAGAKR